MLAQSVESDLDVQLVITIFNTLLLPELVIARFKEDLCLIWTFCFAERRRGQREWQCWWLLRSSFAGRRTAPSWSSLPQASTTHRPGFTSYPSPCSTSTLSSHLFSSPSGQDVFRGISPTFWGQAGVKQKSINLSIHPWITQVAHGGTREPTSGRCAATVAPRWDQKLCHLMAFCSRLWKLHKNLPPAGPHRLYLTPWTCCISSSDSCKINGKTPFH